MHYVQVNQHMIRHHFPTAFCGSAFTEELDLLPGGWCCLICNYGNKSTDPKAIADCCGRLKGQNSSSSSILLTVALVFCLCASGDGGRMMGWWSRWWFNQEVDWLWTAPKVGTVAFNCPRTPVQTRVLLALEEQADEQETWGLMGSACPPLLQGCSIGKTSRWGNAACTCLLHRFLFLCHRAHLTQLGFEQVYPCFKHPCWLANFAVKVGWGGWVGGVRG